MDAARYRRLTELFESAVALPAGERDAWLSAACDDDALRAEVAELLANDERGAFSDDDLARRRDDAEAALDALVAESDDDEPVWRPERVGRYEVVGVLGRGGMGVVYEALQPHPRRRVALKLVHPMLADAEGRRRLEREADILARLQHPGIAQVFEAGSADLGHGEQPWFAMELVDGVDLRTWAAREGLDARARLELVARVADAVHHAHEHGVVHRDLKPDNVLVDTRGQPKVLDFGVARASDTTALLTSMTTASGALMGTLAYMAPEQLDPSRGATGPWSDVYALGVIAYELLSGRRPYDVAGMSLSGAVTSITDGDAAPLRRIDADLPTDAETIVGAALSPEIPKRYPSAAALADDIRRFLDDRPLSARPPSRVDRALRFARRHRALVGGVAATLIALTFGGLVALDFALEEQTQRRIANTQRREADRRAWRANVALATDALNRGDQRAARGFADTAAQSEFAGWETALLATSTQLHDLDLPLGAPVLGDATAGPLALEDDGRLAAYAMRDGTLAAWDIVDGRRIGVLVDADGAGFRRVAGRIPGGRVVAVTAAGRIVAWNPTSGAVEELARIDDAGTIDGLTASADGARVVVSGTNLTLVDDGEVVVLDRGGDGAPFADAALSPDGRELIVLERRGFSNQYARFDVDARRRVLEAGTRDQAMSVSADGSAIVGVRITEVSIRDGRTLQEIGGPLRRHLGRGITSAAVSPDGTWAATATELDVCLWRVAPFELEQRWSHAPLGGGALVALRFSLDGAALLGVKRDRLLSWELTALSRPLAPRVVAPAPRWSYDACLSPDGTLLASRGREADPNRLTITDTRTGEVVVALPAVDMPPSTRTAALAFSDDGTRVLTWTAPDRLAHFDLAAGRLVERLGPRESTFVPWDWTSRWIGRDAIRLGVVRDAADGWFASVQPDDVALVAAHANAEHVALWNARDGRSDVTVPDGRARCVALRPGATDLAVGLPTGGVLVFDRVTGEERGRFDAAHGASTWGVAYAPDGRRLASAGNDGRVLVWDADDVAGGPLLALVAAEGSYAFMPGWSADGTRLFATTGAGTVALWDCVPRDARRSEALADRQRRDGLRDALEERLAEVGGDRARTAEALRDDPSLDETTRAALLRLLVERPIDGRIPAVVEHADRPRDAWLAEAASFLAGAQRAEAARRLAAVPADERDWLTRHLAACALSVVRPYATACGLARDDDGRELFVWQTRRATYAAPLDGSAAPRPLGDAGSYSQLAVAGRWVARCEGPHGSASIRVTDAFTGRSAWVQPIGDLNYITASPTEPAVVEIAPSDGLRCFDADGLRWRHAFDDASNGWARFTHDGQRVVVQQLTYAGVELLLLDAASGTQLVPSVLFDGEGIGVIGDSPTDGALWFAAARGPLRELDPHDLSLRRELPSVGRSPMGDLYVSGDGTRLAVPTVSETAIFDVPSGDVVARIANGRGDSWSKGRVALSHDARHLAATSARGVQSIDRTLAQPAAPATTDVVLSPIDDRPLPHPTDDLAVTLDDDEDGVAVPWFTRPSTGARVCRLHGAPDDLVAWGWSDGGNALVARTRDGSLRAWHDGAPTSADD